jgi:hypothetical protein
MSSWSCLTSKLCDKIIKMPSKSHETIPLIFGRIETIIMAISMDTKLALIL